MQLEQWLKAIGDEVRQRRGGEKQESFADRAGLSREQLSIIENGSRSYGIESLLKILVGTDAPPDWLSSLITKTAHRHHGLFDLLATIVDSGDEQALEFVRMVLEKAHEEYVEKKAAV